MQFIILFLLTIVSCDIVLCEHKSNKQKSKNVLANFGYIRGYKIGYKDTLMFPGFFVSPVFVVHVLNQNKNADIQTINNEDNTRNTSTVSTKIDNESQKDNSDIEVNFRQALDRGNGNKKELKPDAVNETNIEINNNGRNITTLNEDTTNETITTTTTTTEKYFTQETTITIDTATEGLYPNAIPNNNGIDSLSITIEKPHNELYPPLTDKRWQNFTVSTNISILKENTTKPLPSDSLNITGYPSVNKPDSPIKGVYPAALYNNAEIDQLSITTNSYTNESPLPPTQDDRWKSFSTLGKMLSKPNEFRPLAGLYYDGFLHRPVNKAPGFVPYNRYDLY